MKRSTQASPNARLTGLIYLLYFAAAIPGLMLIRQFVVPHDAAATANAILANESLYRLGSALDIASNALYMALTVLLYNLLKPVGPRFALLAAFLSLSGCSLQLCGDLFQVAPLVILKDSQLATAFDTRQIQTAALLSLRLYSQVFNISFQLFGLFDVLVGWLIVRSGFLPWFIGVLWMLAGLSWLSFVWPPFALQVSTYVVVLGMLAEGFLMLWLLILGVNVPKWRELALGEPPSVEPTTELRHSSHRQDLG